MSRFYFHIRQGNGLLVDDEGMLLCDAAAASAEAFQSTRDLSQASIRAGKGLDGSLIVIMDEQGRTLGPAGLRRLLN
jgi:hypothetical protein